jgi:hypothetical protein
MNLYFYIVLFVLILGVGGSIYGFCEWAFHGFKYKTIFLWSLGLLFLNWYQVPTLVAFFGQSVTLTAFDLLFSLALPIAFLGFALIYLGSLAIIRKITLSRSAFFLAWFIASLFYYRLYYEGSMPLQNAWPVIGSNLLFFMPVFLLNLSLAVSLYRRIPPPGPLSIKAGVWAYILASCAGLVRTGLSLFFGLTYPPQFAALRFFSPPFIVAQAVGMIILLISFFFLHKNIDQFG